MVEDKPEPVTRLCQQHFLPSFPALPASLPPFLFIIKGHGRWHISRAFFPPLPSSLPPSLPSLPFISFKT